MENGGAAQTAKAEQRYPRGIAYVDGEFVPISEAKISVLDFGFVRSDATYDVVHVWERKFFRLDKHVDRFLASVAKLRMTLPVGRDGLIEILKETVRRSGLDYAYVEMLCTRGVSPTFSRDPRDAVNNFMTFAIPFVWVATAEQRDRGLRLAISQIPRIPPESVDPTVKNYHWLDLISGLFEAYDRGAENVVLVDMAGGVAEGPGFNLFAVKGGRIATPAHGVLHGITRQTCFDLCEELDIPIEARFVSIDEVHDADEVFISSTGGGFMPVTIIDGKPIGNGKPGPVTATLRDLYWAKHDDPAWTVSIDD